MDCTSDSRRLILRHRAEAIHTVMRIAATVGEEERKAQHCSWVANVVLMLQPTPKAR